MVRMSLADHDLFGGLSGASLTVDRYDLGSGIVISRTFAHLMAPFVMAFAPAEPGKPHPAPWRAAKASVNALLKTVAPSRETLGYGDWEIITSPDRIASNARESKLIDSASF